MRFAFVLSTCALVLSSPAWACRGTAEYPAVRAQIAKADLPAAEMAVHQNRLDQGWQIHERGHKEFDMGLRKKSLEILDDIKSKLGN